MRVCHDIIVSPLNPNPLLKQPNSTLLLVEWSPPFLWPGYFIESYNISIQSHDSTGNISFYQVSSIAFDDAIVSFQCNKTSLRLRQCSLYNFGITPIHTDLVNQSHSIEGRYLPREFIALLLCCAIVLAWLLSN